MYEYGDPVVHSDGHGSRPGTIVHVHDDGTYDVQTEYRTFGNEGVLKNVPKEHLRKRTPISKD